ncbi:MAG: prolipoprotein diacylglyceryl transferase [Anaerolineae bacterium]|jgi:phosphatidylglycerol:prolipoprotein diacylglycerol transferase|nr:prolipoprotein diacylglyceryl transferase [Anaerolineae bacterium]
MPTGFSIGPLFVHFYGIIIMIGAIAATFLAARQSARAGENPETAWDMLPWLLIGGVVGARLWHILTPPASMVEQGFTTGYYLTHPLDAIAIWKGGVGIPGAVIGGVFALWLYTNKYKLSLARWTDYVAPGLILAQGIGRWGNFVNQELYGLPTDLPWAIFIDPQHRLPGYENIGYYHPLFLYESIYNILLAGLLLWIGDKLAKKLLAGDIFLFYLIGYPIGRFFLEFIRLDPSNIGRINANQTLMLIISISAVLGLLWKHKVSQKSNEATLEPETDNADSEVDNS